MEKHKALKERQSLGSSTSEVESSNEESDFEVENYLNLKRKLEKYEEVLKLKKQRLQEKSTKETNGLEEHISSLIDSDNDTGLGNNNSFVKGRQ